MFPLIAIFILILISGAIIVTQASAGRNSAGLPSSTKVTQPVNENTKPPTKTGEQPSDIYVFPLSTVRPAFDYQGKTFSFSGSGYSANSSVILHIKGPDNRELAQIRTNSDNNGSFSHLWDSSISSTAGTYVFWAVDDRTGKATAFSIFTIVLKESETEPEPTPDF